jgi:hypothetical protein
MSRLTLAQARTPFDGAFAAVAVGNAHRAAAQAGPVA